MASISRLILSHPYPQPMQPMQHVWTCYQLDAVGIFFKNNTKTNERDILVLLRPERNPAQSHLLASVQMQHTATCLCNLHVALGNT